MTEPVSSTEEQPDPSSPGMVRSEQELLISTELVESGRARLVKRVEIETVTRTIELRREILEIGRVDPAREPSDATASTDGSAAGPVQGGLLTPGSFRDGVVEIVLMQEEAVITTQMVPRERVRLVKQIITEARAVEADLQAERVDLEQRPISARPVDADDAG